MDFKSFKAMLNSCPLADYGLEKSLLMINEKQQNRNYKIIPQNKGRKTTL